MGQKFTKMIPAACVIVCCAFLHAPRVRAQVSLQEQLAAQYKLVKMGSDTSGYSVTEEGTLLAVQKGGILGVPYSDKTMLTTKYEGGNVHSPNGLMVAGKKSILGHFSQTSSQGQTTALMKKGDKVYPLKVDVNLDKDQVAMAIVECDTCNKTDPPTYNKANVVFQFPKGSLAKASAGDVEDTIGQLLSVSDDKGGGDQGGQQAGGDQAQGQDQGGGQQAQGGGDQQAPAQQQQADPQTVEVGMTPDQVTNALGKPDKIVKLPNKQIYIYKDMKVIFKDGKVSDVQ
jgi:hypothetical protein